MSSENLKEGNMAFSYNGSESSYASSGNTSEHFKTLLGFWNTDKTGYTSGQLPPTKIVPNPIAEAVTQQEVFADRRKNIGLVKACISRAIRKVEKNSCNPKVLNSSHKELDTVFNPLQLIIEELLNMPNLTLHEKLDLQKELTCYEDKVNNAKDFATSQMSYLDRMFERDKSTDSEATYGPPRLKPKPCKKKTRFDESTIPGTDPNITLGDPNSAAISAAPVPGMPFVPPVVPYVPPDTTTTDAYTYEPPGIVNWRGEYKVYMERPFNEIPQLKFDGTSRTPSWEAWKQNYVATCGGMHFADSTKVVILLSMLEGNPRALLETFTSSPYNTESYRAMWNALETNYGGVRKQQKALRKLINKFVPIKKFNQTNTMLLENLLNRIRREFSQYSADVDPGGILNEQVQELIPAVELECYFWEIAKSRQLDTLGNFTEFISLKRRALAQADADLSCEDEPSCSSYATLQASAAFLPWTKRREQELSKDSTITVDPAKPGPKPAKLGPKPEQICPLCKEGHKLSSCPEFRIMLVKDKFAFVKKKKLCTRCLIPGHIQNYCTSHPGITCNIDGCKKRHHRQLHNYTENGRAFITCETYV